MKMKPFWEDIIILTMTVTLVMAIGLKELSGLI